jgi:hypothetical protein
MVPSKYFILKIEPIIITHSNCNLLSLTSSVVSLTCVKKEQVNNAHNKIIRIIISLESLKH